MVMVEETYLPLTLFAPNLTDDEFQKLCEQYSNYQLEYTAEGEVIIGPPTDPETSARNATLVWLLRTWVNSTKNGIVTDSSGGFVLLDQARFAPDAAWLSRERLHSRPACPEFVVELLSPFDRRKKVHKKMLQWVANGAELAWMIDPEQQAASIYRPGREVEVRKGISEIEGEGPVAGFVLDLREIWNV
jgi:Uma2 family endonuclease